ncbi:MAG TPA: transketolase, partial [Usitatibacter sp.]|nr:transketolase [Usitatibacter sp.]
AARFEAYGWHTQHVEDGNDLAALNAALEAARAETKRPSLILVRTHLGYGSPNKHDTYEAHGSPLGADEVKLTKENLGWPVAPPFLIPSEALAHFREAVEKGKAAEAKWNDRMSAYAKAFPDDARELQRLLKGELPPGWDKAIPQFPAEAKGLATRVAAGKVMNAIAPAVPELCGGSADLDPSTYTGLKDQGDFQPPGVNGPDMQGSAGGGWNYAGRNVHFGVREHAMGAICNGMAAHGGIVPYGATFLVFSDYMRPAIRLSALMGLHTVQVFTHDSIALGEDGPTHQPVEHLAALRAIPDLTVIRPGDANEAAMAWRVAMESRGHPVALILSRQNLPTLDRTRYASAEGLRRGAYVLLDAKGGKPDLILIATGSEVSLIVGAADKLAADGIAVRCVSMPSWELFEALSQAERDKVLPPSVTARLAVEAGIAQGWERYVGEAGDVLSIERFGASAPGDVMLKEFGFTVDNVCKHAKALVKR